MNITSNYQIKKEIQSEELLSEVSIKGHYQKLRAKRVEYENCTYIDLRIMQYMEDEEGRANYIYTKKGIRVLEEDFKKLLSEMRSY